MTNPAELGGWARRAQALIAGTYKARVMSYRRRVLQEEEILSNLTVLMDLNQGVSHPFPA